MKLLRNILKRIRQIRTWYKFIWKAEDHDNVYKTPHLNFYTRFKYALLGFSKVDYYFYDLKHNDYHNYISHRERLRLEDINGRFGPILGEKVLFERIFGQFVDVPQTICYVKNGELLSLDKNTIQSWGGVIEILKSGKILIAKPTRSLGGGSGVHVFSYNEDSFILDAKVISENELRNYILQLNEYLISEFIRQNDFENHIYQLTTNTIRIITVIDNNRAKAVFAAHRFGTHESIPVDNACSGGIFANINLKDGTMTACHCYNHPTDEYEEHPDSKERIKDVIIPGFTDLIKKLENAHNCFPYFRFFAWDVISGEDGKYYICEINRGSDLRPWQMNEPLRHTPLGEWMRKEGLLDKW